MKRLILLLLLAGAVSAYSNSSMTGPYNKLLYGDPIHAIIETFTDLVGGWFYLAIVMGPYIGLWLYQGDMHIPTIWLTCCLVAYSTVITGVPTIHFYLLGVFWVMNILLRLLSPKYSW